MLNLNAVKTETKLQLLSIFNLLICAVSLLQCGFKPFINFIEGILMYCHLVIFLTVVIVSVVFLCSDLMRYEINAKNKNAVFNVFNQYIYYLRRHTISLTIVNVKKHFFLYTLLFNILCFI